MSRLPWGCGMGVQSVKDSLALLCKKFIFRKWRGRVSGSTRNKFPYINPGTLFSGLGNQVSKISLHQFQKFLWCVGVCPEKPTRTQSRPHPTRTPRSRETQHPGETMQRRTWASRSLETIPFPGCKGITCARESLLPGCNGIAYARESLSHNVYWRHWRQDLGGMDGRKSK